MKRNARKASARQGASRARAQKRARHKSDTTTDRPEAWFINWATGDGETAAGVTVTPTSALRNAAVWDCVRIRADDIAKIPLILYQRRDGGGKDRATDHPLYRLLHDQPNARQTSFEFRQIMQAAIDLRGNAYAIKEFDGRGRVAQLVPVHPSKVTVKITDDGEVFYEVQKLGTFPEEGILHLRGFSIDGVIGLSPITYHRETIGLALAAQKYGAAFFGNSAQPKGALKVPGVLKKEAAERLRSDWEDKYKGADKSGRLAIFDAGMEWQAIGMDNTDAQYLESRGFQLAEIARMYRMPPHKIGDLSKATFSNIEHQSLEYVVDTLMPEIRRWEQRLFHSLLSEDEQQDYFFEFLVDGLLRGDIKSRYEAYAIGRNWGWFSADDIRERENMNPLPDGKGRIYLQPLNMVEAGAAPGMSVNAAKHLLALAEIHAGRDPVANGKGMPDA